jgi:hypothetical protein
VSKELIPVFSGGVGRSGTTIVGRILRKHPDLFSGAPNEIRFITETYGLIDLVYGMREFVPTQMTTGGKLAVYIPLNPSIKFRYWVFRKRVLDQWWKRVNRVGEVSGLHRSMKRKQMVALLDELESGLDDPISAGRNFVFGFIQNHRRFKGQKFWMDTTPPNMMYADHIYKLLPESRFIEMRRHPLDNIASVIREPWGPNDPYKAIPWFRDRIDLATRAKLKIPSNQHLTLWLEDLVLNSREESYRKMLDVVGLTDDENMHKFFQEEVTAERANMGRWKSGFENPTKVRSEFERIVGVVEREQ